VTDTPPRERPNVYDPSRMAHLVREPYRVTQPKTGMKGTAYKYSDGTGCVIWEPHSWRYPN
jgi:hypothetical protein